MNDYDNISEIYDLYNDAEYDINFYKEYFQNFKGKALELMCGTGRISIPLLKLNINLDCLDISKNLLNILNKKLDMENLKSNLIEKNVLDIDFKDKYDRVFIGFNSLSEIIDLKDQLKLFLKIKSILNEKGEFLFTIYNPLFRRKFIKNGFEKIKEFETENNLVEFFISQIENERNIVHVKQKYIFRDKHDLSKNKEEFLNLKFILQTKEETEDIIKESGFRIKNIFGDFNKSKFSQSSSPFLIYILC